MYIQYVYKAGVRTVSMILILYYASFDKSLPVKDRLMAIAALVYFYLIPKVPPEGFADDTELHFM